MKKTIIIILILFILISSLMGCEQKNDELIDVTFVLDWTPNTNHTGIYVAKELGYFNEVGLNVKIIQPSEGTAEYLVASGSADFGISYQENVTIARSEGLPIVSIAAIIQHNSSGFLSRADENILSVVDFENKNYGGWGGPIEQATIKYLMEQAGGDFSKVQIITAGDIDFFSGTATGNIDFSWVFAGWSNIQADIEGIDINYIDLGKESDVFDYYTPLLITSESNIQNDNVTKKFMEAVTKGYEYCIEYPEQAADILLVAAPELPAELVLKSQQFLADKYQDDAAYWGYQSIHVWQRYMDWLVENQFIDQPINIEGAFTNDYLK